MARKKRSGSGSRQSADAAQAARESAQRIWLAGLGAFARARSEGPRVFEALVEQGRTMGARAVGLADQALKSVREARTTGGWDKLEQAFEDRLTRSLERLGVTSRGRVEDLARQVRELNDNLEAYMARAAAPSGGKARAGAKRRSRAAAKPAAAKAKGRTSKSRAARPRTKARRVPA